MKQRARRTENTAVRAFPALALAALISLLSSCSAEAPTAEPTPEPPALERTDVALHRESLEGAYVTFTTGYVDRKHLLEEFWVPVELGDTISVDQTVRTGANSFVELLFNKFALIRIDSNTEVLLQDFVGREDRNRVELRLGSGSVATRVLRLTTTDRFRVGTSTAVAGVRGTSFSVHATPEGETRVTVRSGRVTVVPRAVAEIEDSLEAEEDEEIREQLTRIVAAIEERSIVDAREEAEVDVNQLLSLENRVRQVIQEIETVQREETETLRRSSVRHVVETALSSFRQTPPPVPFVRRNAGEEELRRIEELDRIPVDPADASREQPYVSAEPETATAEPPSDSDVGEEPAAIPIPPPEARVASLPAEPSLPDTGSRIDSRPDPVERRIEVSDVPIIGLHVRNDIIFSADAVGTLRAHNATGNELWALTTANAPNENSVPVLSGNHLYFSGAREFVVVRISDGTLIHRRALNAQDAHLFGRRVVAAGSQLVFPANTELRVIESDGRVRRSIPLRNSSGMTPAHHEGNLFIADTQGGVSALSFDDGSIVWSTQTNAIQPIAHAPAIDENYAFLSGRRGRVVAIRIENGEVVWERDLDPGVSIGVFTDPAVTTTTVFFHGGNRLFALNKATGADRYPPVPEVTTPPLVHGSMVAFGSRSVFTVMDAGSGTQRYRVSVDAVATGRPALLGNRYVVGTQAGAILVLNPEGF